MSEHIARFLGIVLIFLVSLAIGALLTSSWRLLYNWCETHRHLHSIRNKMAADEEAIYDSKKRKGL